MSRPSTILDAIRSSGSGAAWPARVARAPLRALLWLTLRRTVRVRVEGTRVAGPAVIASNHPNLIDGLLVLLADPHMRPIARWHRLAITRAGLWVGNSVITTTGTPANPPRGAFADALAHLRSGGRVWIAPEGGWQPLPTLRAPRTGAVRLAHAARVPLQVLAIRHARHPGPDFRRIATWRRRTTVVRRWGPCVATTGDVPADVDRLMTALARTAGMIWQAPPAADGHGPPTTAVDGHGPPPAVADGGGASRVAAAGDPPAGDPGTHPRRH